MINLKTVAEIKALKKEELVAYAAEVKVEAGELTKDQLAKTVIDQVELLNAFATKQVETAKKSFAGKTANAEPIEFEYQGKQYRLNTHGAMIIPGIGRVKADQLPEHEAAIAKLIDIKYHLLVEIKAKKADK